MSLTASATALRDEAQHYARLLQQARRARGGE